MHFLMSRMNGWLGYLFTHLPSFRKWWLRAMFLFSAIIIPTVKSATALADRQGAFVNRIPLDFRYSTSAFSYPPLSTHTSFRFGAASMTSRFTEATWTTITSASAQFARSSGHVGAASIPARSITPMRSVISAMDVIWESSTIVTSAS